MAFLECEEVGTRTKQCWFILSGRISIDSPAKNKKKNKDSVPGSTIQTPKNQLMQGVKVRNPSQTTLEVILAESANAFASCLGRKHKDSGALE